jgi:4-methyl-5(b-hydroxyethyl)-thiazole monophosphate biosynthesis
VCSVEEEGRLEVVCSRGVKLVADVNVKDVSGRNAPNDWDLIAVPGGMPGAERIADHIKFDAVLKKHFMAGKLMAAICAAPAICFEPKGFLEGYAATAHPAFVDELGGSLQEKNIYAEARVVVDREVVTSRGPGTALEWALCLVERLYGTEHCKKIAGPMVVQPANARIRNQLEWRLDETPLSEE